MNLRVAGFTLGCWVFGVFGCLGRSLPTPPPGATVESVTDCAPSVCPSGGVIVTLVGTAMPGAQVVIEDQNPATMGARGEVLGAIARATPTGEWRATVFPETDVMSGAVRAVQRGDSLGVYQISPPPDSQPSAALLVLVPRR